MDAGVLATQGAKAAAFMVLTLFDRDILISVPEGLMY